MFDSGKTLDETTVKRGLKELQSGLHFDMGAKLGIEHPFMATRQGVFYSGKHICSMDRGPIPEFKVWSVRTGIAPCSITEADDPNVSIRWREVLPTHPEYIDLYEAAAGGKTDDYFIRTDGKLIHIEAQKITKVRDRVVSVGWRHTFERLLQAKIPGITRSSLSAKFGVDMLKYPVGPPEELIDALVKE